MQLNKPNYVVKRLPKKGEYLVITQKAKVYITKLGKYWKPQQKAFPYFTTLRDAIMATVA